jgi:two-component system chemotaxis response regulator CheY
MKILIVDDSAFMRTILKGIIAKGKYHEAEIIEATNGNEAVQMYNEHKPDLVLLDLIMPEKDGISVLKDIGHSAQSVVIISSIDQPEIIDQAKTLGAKEYIMKPFDAVQVDVMLEKMLQG